MKKLLLFILLLIISISMFAVTQYLTIIHVNDTHGHAWQYSEFNNPDIGGFAAVSSIIDSIREEVAVCGGDVLVLHAGDYNTGVPESDQLDAVPDIVAMNMIGFDAVTLGNHEFDFEREILNTQMDLLDCSVLSANTVDENGSNVVLPYVVFEYETGLKVAVIGLTTEETAIHEPIYLDDWHFENAIETTKKFMPEMKEKADIIVALTHLGFQLDDDETKTTSDELALGVNGLDVIVDGHSHSLFEKPVLLNDSVIVQAGEWNKYVGRLDLTIVDGEMVDYEWDLIPVNLKNNLGKVSEGEEVIQDPKILAVMDYFLKLGGEKLNTLVGKTEITLDGEVASLRTKGTNLGNLITDAMAWKTNSEIAILNAGGIRASINVGDITYRDVLKVLPFGNTICVLQLYGKEIIEIIDYVVSIQPGKGAYPQISGLTFTYENGEVKDVMVNGEVLENERVYRIATNDYLALGGDGYEVFKTKGENVYDTGFVLDKVIVDYIQSLGTITEYSSESRYNRK